MTEPTAKEMDAMMDLAALAAEPLDPELTGWVEQGAWGPMLRHPLVYAVPLHLNGMVNKALAHKKKALAAAIEAKDWHTVVFLHERPHRLNALIEYCTGRMDDAYGNEPFDLAQFPQFWGLAEHVWTDSENIEQHEEDWRALFLNGEPSNLWLGDREAFYALPDPIPAWRGGTVGDWSWTTDEEIAKFFSRRSGYKPRHALIPKADCFGYLTRRGESELLVRMTPEREPLVYPNRFPETEEAD